MLTTTEIKNSAATIERMTLKELRRFYPFMSKHLYSVLPKKAKDKIKKAEIQIIEIK